MLSISWMSCDKIDDPFPDTGTSNIDTTSEHNFENPDLTTLKRRILLEDYTGHTCGNCPSAALTAATVKSTFGSQVYIMAVHAGFFAEPYGGGNKFTSDYRTEVGEEWNTDFAVTGNPKGMVSRVEYNSATVLDPSAWNSAASILSGDSPLFDIQMESEFSESENSFSLTVGSYIVNDISGNYNLSVCLIEDSIIDWQKNYDPGGDPAYASPEEENYIHQHMLRDNINSGTYGENIITGSALGDTWVITSYDYTLDSEWNPDHCSIIAFISDATNKEILQVGEIHVKNSH